MSFEPWMKYPSLTLERLVKVADVIRITRKGAADLHDRDSGDSSWSLGCRAYSRICYVLRQTSKEWAWLRILDDHQHLRFTFTIGQIPLRFYKGDPDDPPSRSLMVAYPELRQRQIALDLGVALEHNEFLRLAVETDQKGYVSRVTLVELDEDTNEVTNAFEVPLSTVQENIASHRPKGIDLPPVTIEPLEKHDDENVEGQREVG